MSNDPSPEPAPMVHVKTDKVPLRYQFYALGGILGFTAVIGASVYGIRAAGTSSYIEPACEKSCAAVQSHFADVEFHMGKQDHDSLCICTNNARLPSPEANTIGTLSALTPIALGLLMAVVLIAVVAKRSRRA